MKNKNLLYALGGVVGVAAIAVVIMLSLNSGSNLKGMLPGGYKDDTFGGRLPSATSDLKLAPTKEVTNNPVSKTLGPVITNLIISKDPFDLRSGSVTFSADIKNDNKNVAFMVYGYKKGTTTFACEDGAPGQGNLLTRSNGKVTCTWNGRDENGNFVTPGNYSLNVQVFTGGAVWSFDKSKDFKIIDSRINAPKVLIK
ncbi:MAG: hypothetical protein WC843_03035 [Candidatus Gracilibacteria bacterium]|jgi:hypothetical protein